jgi:uncharacterized cofD-like protein
LPCLFDKTSFNVNIENKYHIDINIKNSSKAPHGMSRMVCIGGGTGLHTLLLGLKERFPHMELAAVVSMMDSGGSTGRLRDEFGYLPPGDIRQCLIALSDAPLELRKLMQHRFKAKGSPLDGHVIGNLLLTAFKDLHGGNEVAAIEAMERILRIRGKVHPVTTCNCQLVATLEDGSVVRGETNIDVPKHDPSLRIRQVALEPDALIFPRTADVIENADYLIIGPGDLYTSIMPNLVIGGMTDAIRTAQRKGACLIYITNTMTKHGETNGFTASDHLAVIQAALDGAKVDAVIINDGEISPEQREAYEREHAHPVVNDVEASGVIVVAGDLVNKDVFARHNSHKLADAVAKAIEKLDDL